MYDVLVVGAGFAGSILAERIASQLNKKVLVIDRRNHIAGNSYDEIDKNGILIHKYGPHIFHTNSKIVSDYLSAFTEWRFYEHKVLASNHGVLYPIPINRMTINKFYNLDLVTDKETRDFINSLKGKAYPILNSEDYVISQVGSELFETFFKHYTEKQWGVEAKELAPSVCGRIPIRYNDDCRYFSDSFQFMPKDGYTKMFEKILTHKNIHLELNLDYKTAAKMYDFRNIIFTGPIDNFFDYEYGRLQYRSIRFEFVNIKSEQFQPVAQINYVSDDVPFTRVIEHKHLTGQKAESTTITREYPLYDGEPFYPIPNEKNRTLYLKYKEKALSLHNVFFCGRLAEYQYFNMDQVTANALKFFNQISSKL